MAARQERAFRIEGRGVAAPDGDNRAEARHQELLDAVALLKAEFSPEKILSSDVMESLKSEVGEVVRLKAELDAISAAIDRTKEELASLHPEAASGEKIHRVTDELSAVVDGTENATESILVAAEAIDEKAGNLAAKLTGADSDMAGDIQDAVIRIFEACNFQDLTGQRITKVVAAMGFIDERISRMMEIWGGIEAFQALAEAVGEPECSEKALLNGPALEADLDRATQDDIDALFD